jgi:hypothetical protein
MPQDYTSPALVEAITKHYAASKTSVPS